MVFKPLLLSVFLLGAKAIEVLDGTSTDLYVVNKHIAPDGYNRPSGPALLVGGSKDSASIEGALVVGRKNDDFNIKVHNLLTNHTLNETTTIHWHGILQTKTPWSDGSAFVNQCPITPGHAYTYHFSTGGRTGTFWYHAHLEMQTCDGLRGPMVIYDDKDPYKHMYDVDNENTIITLADWYNVTAPGLVGVAQTPPPESTLINGKGREPLNPTAPLSVVSVKQGKRYRFRLINISCRTHFTFSIDSHRLTLIEADSQLLANPLTVDILTIYTGQRYSFVLEANQKPSSYWIRSEPNRGNLGFQNGINSAVLRYTHTETEKFPNTTIHNPNSSLVLREPQLRSTVGGVPQKADHVFNLTLSNTVQGSGLSSFRYLVNGSPYENPSETMMLQILRGQKPVMPANSTLEVGRNKTVEVILNGGDALGGPHPFHLHGHQFWVVKSSSSDQYNYMDPVRRDVSAVAAGNTTVIRFQTDHAGPWMLHCHMNPHFTLGLAVVFIVQRDEVPEPPQAWKDLCTTYDKYNNGTAL